MRIKLLLLSLLLTFAISAQEQYYTGVDLTAEGAELKENLAAKTIGAHTTFLSYTPGVWESSKITDVNPENSSEVLLIYGYSASGTTARTSGINNSGGNQGEWNREHTYAKSLGNPNLGSSGPGADAHHLRPSDVQYNGQRGNLKFADGAGNSGSVSGGWYPGDEWKGDIARMMMYMYIRYGNQCQPNNVGIGSNAATGDFMIDLFLDWNVEDPVSDFERQKNTHHDSNQNYAQGNRNPFIDNAYLATRIWGGAPAEDSWGIYTSNDNEAPTVPTSVVLSNATTSSINVSWTAATDNEAVTKYEIYANGTLNGETASTNYTATGFNSNTSYAITVLAKDLAGNASAQSAPANGTTTTDTTAPSVPSNVNITFITGTSFQVNWTASTDNTAVTSYDVYIDGAFNGAATGTNYTVSGLTISTDYSVRVLAKDSANNQSAQSTAVTATTTNGVNSVVELFFSEYVEGVGNNKALEIVNLTDNPINLSGYSIKKQSNGAGGWINALPLNGTIDVNDVFVMIHFQADDATLVAEADLVAPEGSNYGAPVNFNGNDAVGLFKDDVLIDIIGVLGETAKNFESMTLRRKLTITTPNTTYIASEWDQYAFNTFEGIGTYNATAGLNSSVFNSFKIYPNPTYGNTVYFKVGAKTKIKAYNVLGKLVQTAIIDGNNKSMDITTLDKGIYILRVQTANEFITQKLIKR
ncbi:endonuclease [Polaribacter sp.]|nr:endonuclease [Polaribacter sp.]